jgi:XTP/dITP diphosphohydrolase
VTGASFAGDRRWLAPGALVLASHNSGKVREIAVLLGSHGIEPISAATLGLPEPEETEDSFIGNARLKSLAAATATGMVALSDDSGLCVDALGGAPGIYSARWAGEAKNFAHAMEQVERALAEKQTDAAGRTAHFVCALSLAWPDGHTEDFEGKVFGDICCPPRGTKGFGYDPIFVPRGFDISFGEMDPDAKHAMSHRAKAFEQLVRGCLTRSAV